MGSGGGDGSVPNAEDSKAASSPFFAPLITARVTEAAVPCDNRESHHRGNCYQYLSLVKQ